MASESHSCDHLNKLSNEILSMLFRYLSFPDLIRCMSVCRRFNTIIKGKEFWKKYLNENYNFTVVNKDGAQHELTGVNTNLGIIKNDWLCFWDESYENVAPNDPSRYMFRPFPQIWSNGIITPGNFDPCVEVPEYYSFNKALYLLLQLRKKCSELQITTSPYYSTIDAWPDVCLFPWPKDEMPQPTDVLEIFNAHNEIIEKFGSSDLVYASEMVGILTVDSDSEDYYEASILSLNNTFSGLNGNEENKKVLEWLQKYFQPSLMFCAGVDAVHPQVYFHLTILAPGWAGGIFAIANLV